MRKLFLLLCLTIPYIASAQRPFYASWGSKDISYSETAAPCGKILADTTVTAWRGERVGVKALVYTEAEADSLALNLKLPKGITGTAGFMDYVLTDNFQRCGVHPTNLTPYRVADIIDTANAKRLDAYKLRPVWVTIEVPTDAKAGVYKTQLTLADAVTGKTRQKLNLSVKVLDRTLPTPDQQTFHVDFWQQPYAVSRYHGVERWSDAHFEALRPYLQLLARCGQRVVSAVLFYEPWGDQSFDKFDAMVRTVRHKDGTWSYDYTVFDKWVTLCADCGIDRQINCYSMVPWDMTFRYYDEAKGKDVDLKTKTNTEEYKQLWTAFLKSFAAHLKERGWFDKTCIAMDERGLENMKDAYRVAQEAAPGIKMALAGSHHKELIDKLYDYCIDFSERFSAEELAARRARGQISTTYTCCSTPAPNIFSNSLPAEAAWLPVFCVANDFDGYLHWSWMNWAEQPLTDSRYRLFAPGDTYLIYPGPRSSVRYERFIEGVAMAEKIKILRAAYKAAGDTAALEALNRVVATFSSGDIPQGKTAAQMVNELQGLLNR